MGETRGKRKESVAITERSVVEPRQKIRRWERDRRRRRGDEGDEEKRSTD